MKGYNIDTTDFTINTADNVRYREPNHDQWFKNKWNVIFIIKFVHCYFNCNLFELSIFNRLKGKENLEFLIRKIYMQKVKILNRKIIKLFWQKWQKSQFTTSYPNNTSQKRKANFISQDTHQTFLQQDPHLVILPHPNLE